MEIYHVKVILRDTVSRCTTTKSATVSENTLIKMCKSLGQRVPRFENDIHFVWVAESITTENPKAMEIINSHTK